MRFSRALDIRLIELHEIDRRLIDLVRTLPLVSGCSWPVAVIPHQMAMMKPPDVRSDNGH